MNPLIVYYLLISAIHSVPLAVITFGLHYDNSSHFSPKVFNDQIVKQLRRNGITRFEQFCQALNSDNAEYLARFSLFSLLFHLLTMLLILMAEIFDVPLPFLSDIGDSSIMDKLNNFVNFSALIACVQLIPLVVFASALIIEIKLPFLSRQTENHAPSRNEIARERENSEEIISIRLSQFENSNKTLNANCRDNQLGELFEIVVCQGKDTGDKPECFLYTNNKNMEPINPAPVGVNQLNQIFASNEEETVL